MTSLPHHRSFCCDQPIGPCRRFYTMSFSTTDLSGVMESAESQRSNVSTSRTTAWIAAENFLFGGPQSKLTAFKALRWISSFSIPKCRICRLQSPKNPIQGWVSFFAVGNVRHFPTLWITGTFPRHPKHLPLFWSSASINTILIYRKYPDSWKIEKYATQNVPRWHRIILTWRQLRRGRYKKNSVLPLLAWKQDIHL